jgi:hypothetical protein
MINGVSMKAFFVSMNGILESSMSLINVKVFDRNECGLDFLMRIKNLFCDTKQWQVRSGADWDQKASATN